MCGRFALYTPSSTIKEQFGLEELFDIEPRYNIAPTEDILTLSQMEGKGLSASMLYWGLVPFWADDKKIGHRLINARAETVSGKPAFRAAFKKRRCIIVMSGFFEWKQEANRKQPYFIKSEKESLIAVAGLWEHWQGEGGESIQSCCIVTRDANEFMKPIHQRMPVILDKEQQDLWLAQDTDDKILKDVLVTKSSTDLTGYPVTPKMNYAGYKQQDTIVPINQ